MSDAVCFAAMMPARRAACSGSPFATAPRRICARASRVIVIDPRAMASRAVTGFSPTSTIRTRPRASTCDSLLRVIALLRKIKGQALERDRQVHALQLDVFGHAECSRREIQDRLDPGGHDQIDDPLGGRGGDGDDRDADAVAARQPFQIVDVADRHAASRLLADLLAEIVEQGGNLEALLAKARVIGEGQSEVAGADDGDLQLAIETEDLPQMALQIADVVA